MNICVFVGLQPGTMPAIIDVVRTVGEFIAKHGHGPRYMVAAILAPWALLLIPLYCTEGNGVIPDFLMRRGSWTPRAYRTHYC